MSEQPPRRSILVVDDEKSIRRFLRSALGAYGYQVIEAAGGKEALDLAVERNPDVVILDLGLPDMDGMEVTRRLRKSSVVPIIILSVREAEGDKVAALDAGADDYLTKPFGIGELMARLRAALRRISNLPEQPVFEKGDLVVDLQKRFVKVRGEEVRLTPNEFDLLRQLVLNAGYVMTHHQLLTNVWGPAYKDEMHLLRVNMSNLRRKLETDPTRPEYILTEPGVGYRLVVE